MSVRRHVAVVASTIGLVSATLVTGSGVGTAQPRAHGTEEQTAEVLVKRDHTVAMPTTLRPGVTTFHVSSRRDAAFQLVQPRDGYRKRQFSRDAFKAFEKNNLRALRRLEARTTLWGGVFPEPEKPATMAVDLPEGTYWALDTMPRRPRPEKIHTFEVAGYRVGGEVSGQVIRAVDEVRWGKVTQHVTRRGTILFENRSTENHFLEILKLKRGKTIRDFRRWVHRVQRGVDSPPPVNERVGTGTGVLSPGQSMSFDYRLPTGDYVMFCFWPDADMGGTPHVFMGMYRGLEVD